MTDDGGKEAAKPAVSAKKAAPAPAAAGQPNAFRRMTRYVTGKVKTGFAIAGAAAAVGAYLEYKSLFPDGSEVEDKKKKVLVIPFHRIDLQDHHSRNPFDRSALGGWSRDSEEGRVLPMDVKELVDIIHHAAADPSIVALYGIFGHGFTAAGLDSAGWANLEEVRNALKVFREAHRVHPDPNVAHEKSPAVPKPKEAKPLYCYADTFSSLGEPGNKEYYLASMFTHVHLQQKGELNLFGLLSQNFFLKGFLDKYKIKFNVFHSGDYKNAINTFTHNDYTRQHRENVSNILINVNEEVATDIARIRSKAILAGFLKGKKKKKGPEQTEISDEEARDLWRRIQKSGAFPAEFACKAGLVDFVPRRDPLKMLLEMNKKGTDKEAVKEDWGPETEFDRFKAEEAVGLESYGRLVKQKEVAKRKRYNWHKFLHSSPVVSEILHGVGVGGAVMSEDEAQKQKDTVGLVYVQGAIDSKKARATVNTLRNIAKDDATKALVVRVDSPGGELHACETIAQELKGMGKPVLMSFGNVAASGGYYISANADRVFAQSKTVTGSIGVFGIRPDFTGLLKDYGVSVGNIGSSELSGVFSPFHPMSKRMKDVMKVKIDRYYDDFKGVVSGGRGLSPKEVETLAQGRVWTGDQAKSNGLVDEIGGLERAIAFARREYTSRPDDAEVVVWPKPKGFLERIAGSSNGKKGVVPLLMDTLFSWVYEEAYPQRRRNHTADLLRNHGNMEVVQGGLLNAAMNSGSMSGIYMAADENTAIQCLLDEVDDKPVGRIQLPDFFWDG